MLGAQLRRVVELPRPASDDPDPFGLQRTAALAARFHGSTDTLTWAWHRATAGGTISLLTSDLSVPPPSSTFAPTTTRLDELTSIRTWVQLAGHHDGLVDDHDDDNRERSSIESSLLAVWDRPFTLVISADPISGDDLIEELDDTVDATKRALQRKESNPDQAVEHERLDAWHRELRRGETTGIWRISIDIGAENPVAARELAGLAAAALDITHLGYRLIPGQPNDRPFLAGTPLLSALTRPPSFEIPGVRLVLPSEFDVTVENTGDLRLGTALDRERRSAGPFAVSLKSLNRHAFICGATGAGKSQTTRNLLERATVQNIPWAVIEPAKSEYAAMAARLPDHKVIRIRPGDPDMVACGIDPFRPAEGFPLQTHLDLTKALFLAAFEAQEPFPQVLSAALTRAYERQGWNLALSAPIQPEHRPRYPTLADVQACALQVIDEIGYGREVEQNITGFVKVRLASLRLGTTGRFLEGGHPLDIAKLLKSNVVLEIEDVGDDAAKAFLMGVFLIALTEHYRVAARGGQLAQDTLCHLTVIEEAHRLLRNPAGRERGAAANAVEIFASLLAEVRAYGEGIVVAEQIPSKLIPDVIKNTSIKIVHRLPAKDDREAVGATMNLSPAQSEYLVTTPPGVAGCFADGMDNPILVTMPDGTEVERTGDARPSGAEHLTRPTFGRCGAPYDVGPLPLATVARARDLLGNNPVLRWWAELATLAHLTGVRAPSPPADRDQPVTRCALVLALDDAVAARSPLVCDRMTPARLAAHVAADIDDRCAHLLPEWLAAPFRWEPIWHDIQRHRREDPRGACNHRHPHSGLWRARFGHRVPGRTCVEQERAVQARRSEVQTTAAVEELAFGTERPSALEVAAGLGRRHPDWDSTMRTYLERLDARWAERLLRAVTPAATGTDRVEPEPGQPADSAARTSDQDSRRSAM